MNNQNNGQSPRWRTLALLLVSGSLFAAAMPSRQEEDDQTRSLWNKQFLDARERVKKNRPASQPQTAKAKPPATVKAAPKAQAVVDEIVDGELRSVYVPAQGDPAPYFALQRSGANHVGEMLTILISPKPLPVNVERPELDLTTVAQWERQCGGQTERREASGGAGKQRTKAEQEADEGKRKLVQTDPLPQTIYRVRTKQDGCAMVTIPLRMAP